MWLWGHLSWGLRGNPPVRQRAPLSCLTQSRLQPASTFMHKRHAFSSHKLASWVYITAEWSSQLTRAPCASFNMAASNTRTGKLKLHQACGYHDTQAELQNTQINKQAHAPCVVSRAACGCWWAQTWVHLQNTNTHMIHDTNTHD